MRKLLILVSLVSPFYLLAQDCSCAGQLDNIIIYFERNNPAFQKIKTNPEDHKAYKKELKKVRKEARSVEDADQCILYMERYVALLKDHHSGIGFNLKRTDLSTDKQINELKSSKEYLKFKKMTIDTASIIKTLGNAPREGIEGIYSDGKTILFGIIREEDIPGRYIGVILKANKLLDIGHVILELSHKEGNSYDVKYNVGLLGFNFQKIYRHLEIENGQIASFGFSKILQGTTREKQYEFRELNETTNYLRLHSFDYRLTRELDSFYTTIDTRIKSKPYLVIDLRNNGGGSESAYFNLLPYAYTKPLVIDPADVWVSPENINRYEESPQRNPSLIERMKAAVPYTFIPQVEGAMDTWTLDSSTVFPKRIALLYNRGTASAAEGMILYFLQSDKVITVGENSGGYIGYGNVMTAHTPCGKFTVQSTTTKYQEKSKYEFVGIEPMYKVPVKTDWIHYAEGVLKKGN